MTEYFRLLFQFNMRPTLCNFLQLVAYDTWKRIEFTRTRNGLKIFETTITQNILYEFRVYYELYPQIPIRIFEAINEPKNGNDIELLIKTSQGILIAPLQAKLIYNSNYYNAMEHGNQINDLISYANSVGGIPLYLLYNYYPDNTFVHNANLCGITYSKEQFGCSIVSANYLLANFAFNRTGRNGNSKWTIPNFTDLHPTIAIPWFVLGCCRFPETDLNTTINLLNNSSKTGIVADGKAKTYELSELTNPNHWKPLEIKGLDSPSVHKVNESTSFSPKYRIVIETDKVQEIKKEL
jgi:hypothetical protein